METIAQDLATMVRTPLHEDHVEALKAEGRVWQAEPGDMLQELGQPYDEFHYVISGEVEALDPRTRERYGDATLGPSQFFGEIGFIAGANAMLGARACAPSEILSVPREKLLALMSRIPEMSDIIITVFSARRRRQLETDGAASLTLIGGEESRDIRQVAAFAARNRIPFRELTLGEHEAEALAHQCSLGKAEPAVIFGKDEVIHPPTARALAARLGLDLPGDADGDVYDLLIVGGGPAGVAAAVYAGAEGLSALLIEELAVGGQAGTSSRIENYMGFPTGISGADLVWRGEVQAMKFGTRFAVPRRACGLERQEDGTFCVSLDDGATVCAKAVLVATGVQYRRLGLEGIGTYEGAGIYYAATDVEARYCRGSEIAIVGGGNSAGQAAMFLSRSAKHVHVLVRGRELGASMSDYLSQRLEADPRITVHLCHEIAELHGDGETLQAVTVKNRDTGEDWRLETPAAFIMVGAAPNTGWLSDMVDLGPGGYVLTGGDAGREGNPYATSCDGVFAAGDIRHGSVKRVASAVGEGSVVISHVWQAVQDAG